MIDPGLPSRKILLFWFPLLLTWLMMAIEGPYIAAIIARLPQEKYNLAAFGISFSFALIIEAPIIMLMSATIALTKGAASFLKLRKFTFLMNGAIVLVNLIFLTPWVFDFITLSLIGIEKEIADLVYLTSLLLIPWAPAIGYRRFYQGLLIKYNQTRKVTAGTVFRLLAMGLTAWILAKMTHLPGTVIGGAALSMGVVTESIATRILVHSARAKVLAITDGSDSLDFPTILKFYYPLAMTSVIGLSVRPAMVFFLGQSRMALETLAALPVINALLFIFTAIGLSFQEVGVALMGEELQYRKTIQRFSMALATIVATIYGIIVFSPISHFWFQRVSGLSPELAEFALFPAKLLVLMPWGAVFLSYQRALMVNLKTTYHVSRASTIEVVGIIVGLLITINGLDLVGAVAATLAMPLGRFLAVGYLQWKS